MAKSRLEQLASEIAEINRQIREHDEQTVVEKERYKRYVQLMTEKRMALHSTHKRLLTALAKTGLAENKEQDNAGQHRTAETGSDGAKG